MYYVRIRNGEIDIDVTGGTPPYSYSWSNGETSQDVTNLGADSYTVIVEMVLVA